MQPLLVEVDTYVLYMMKHTGTPHLHRFFIMHNMQVARTNSGSTSSFIYYFIKTAEKINDYRPSTYWATESTITGQQTNKIRTTTISKNNSLWGDNEKSRKNLTRRAIALLLLLLLLVRCVATSLFISTWNIMYQDFHCHYGRRGRGRTSSYASSSIKRLPRWADTPQQRFELAAGSWELRAVRCEHFSIFRQFFSQQIFQFSTQTAHIFHFAFRTLSPCPSQVIFLAGI